MATAPLDSPEEPNRFAAALLSAVMHVLLIAVLVFGISWQSRAPEAVSVELWQQLPEPQVAPPPEQKPEPKPEPKPAPPPPPKPAPPPPKPDIVLEKKAPPKPEPKKKEPPLNLDLQRQIREQANKELENVEREREKQQLLAELKPQPAAPAGAPGTDSRYAARVRGKIKALIVVPAGIVGNPEAVFDVEQLPTGDVTSVKLRVSSGNAAYDDAVDRAIRKASPLPKPDAPAQPPRHLELHFHPLER